MLIMGFIREKSNSLILKLKSHIVCISAGDALCYIATNEVSISKVQMKIPPKNQSEFIKSD